jgi:hypothetical protein
LGTPTSTDTAKVPVATSAGAVRRARALRFLGLAPNIGAFPAAEAGTAISGDMHALSLIENPSVTGDMT